MGSAKRNKFVVCLKLTMNFQIVWFSLPQQANSDLRAQSKQAATEGGDTGFVC